MTHDENVYDFNAAKQKKPGRSKKTQEDQADGFRDLIAEAEQFLKEHPMWHVLRQGVYYKRRADGEPMPIRAEYLQRHHAVWNTKFARAVTFVMEQNGWAYNDVTYSFSEVEDDILNLMDRTMWITPEPGEYHPVYDWLTHAVGGGKPEAVDHLRHCIVHKYLHPEDYTLPAMVIFGEGGAGKNVMVNHVFKRLFKGRSLSAESDHITGQFNALVAGQVIVMIDESMADRTSGSKTKLLIGNRSFVANPKGLQPFECENTAWYWIGSNEKENGGIWLDRSHADRRYSVIHIEDGMTLEYWVAANQGWMPFQDYTDDQHAAGTKLAAKWLKDEGIKHLTDPKQIAAWLHRLITEYGERDAPRALHGADYQKLLGVQERVYDRIIKAVFCDEDFTHISKRTLYKGYEMCSKEAGEKGKILDSVLFAKAESFLKKHKMGHIVQDRPRQDTGRHMIWKDNRLPDFKFKIDNTGTYINEFGKWIGPEI